MPRKLKLEDILQYKPAKKAFDELAKAKVRLEGLVYWLCEISAAPIHGTPMGSRQVERRKVEALAEKAKKLAREIEIAYTSPSKIPTMWAFGSFEVPSRVVRLLREFATVWIEAHSILWAKERFYPSSPQNEAINCLIDWVKYTTGKPHYGKIADLLNGIHARQHGENSIPPWDQENLKDLNLRAKKRQAKLLEPLEPLNLPR